MTVRQLLTVIQEALRTSDSRDTYNQVLNQAAREADTLTYSQDKHDLLMVGMDPIHLNHPNIQPIATDRIRSLCEALEPNNAMQIDPTTPVNRPTTPINRPTTPRPAVALAPLPFTATTPTRVVVKEESSGAMGRVKELLAMFNKPSTPTKSSGSQTLSEVSVNRFDGKVEVGKPVLETSVGSTFFDAEEPIKPEQLQISEKSKQSLNRQNSIKFDTSWISSSKPGNSMEISTPQIPLFAPPTPPHQHVLPSTATMPSIRTTPTIPTWTTTPTPPSIPTMPTIPSLPTIPEHHVSKPENGFSTIFDADATLNEDDLIAQGFSAMRSSVVTPFKDNVATPLSCEVTPVIPGRRSCIESHRLELISVGELNPDDNYEMSDKGTDSENDHEEAARKRAKKKIPEWTKDWRVKSLKQSTVDPESIFGLQVPMCDLNIIFSEYNYRKMHAERPKRLRGSSGNWKLDNLTQREVDEYRNKCGQTVKAEGVFRG